MVLIGPSLIPSKPIIFLEAYVCVVHFPHNDALVITMHIGNCWVSKILVGNESSIKILYGGALDRMKDTSEMT